MDVSGPQLDEFLYYLSEELESRVGMSGLYSNFLFRRLWGRLLRHLSIAFFEQIGVTSQGDLIYRPGLATVTGQPEIRKEYFLFIKRLLLSHPANNEIMKAIKEFEKKEK